jgi:tetratricopeptide (TPR) repeat protein
VLRAAIKMNPRDAHASYYLGNLLYDWQPEEAVRLWEDSAAVNPSFAIVHRNLATAYTHQKPTPDLNRAIAELEKAVSLNHKYALHFAELDELYEQTGTPIEKRLPLFEKNPDVVAQRDDAQNRAVALKVEEGKYDEAITMMTGRKFAVAEGSNLNVSEQWANAHILRGQQNIAAKHYKEALTDLQAAVTVPDNLPARGFGEAGRNAEVDYLTGLAYEGLGDQAKASESWNKAMAPAPSGMGRRGGQSQGDVPGPGGFRPACAHPARARGRRPRRSRRPGRGTVAAPPGGQRALLRRPRLPGSRRYRQGEDGTLAGRRNQPRSARRQNGFGRFEVKK